MNERELVEMISNEVSSAIIGQGHININMLHDVSQSIPIGVSNRHVHLSEQDTMRLFGKVQLTKLRELSQPNQFVYKETVTLIGPKGKIDGVRVLGPARGKTQVEISLFDGYTLGIIPPIRNSGDIENTPGITIKTPMSRITVQQGLICAARHIHMHPDDARKFGVRDGQLVSIKIGGERAIIFENVLIRVSEAYRLEMHIDMDEANAGNIRNGDRAILIK